MVEESEDWGPWGLMKRATGSIVAAPVVVGFITLGAGVVVLRALADVATMAWRRSRAEPVAVRSPAAPPRRRRRSRDAATRGDDVPVAEVAGMVARDASEPADRGVF